MSKLESKFWDKLAEGYSKKPVEDPAAFERKIAVTRSLIEPEHRVLDIGCGTGSLALRLADACREVHGLDFSRAMVQIARRKAQEARLSNLTFHVGPFDDTLAQFEPGSLDGICAYSILHLLPERRAAMNQIHALLKPGGFFVSSTVCLGNTWVPYRPLLWGMRMIGKAPWVAILSSSDLATEINSAGFVEVQEVEVGAKSEVSFIVAQKPATNVGAASEA